MTFKDEYTTKDVLDVEMILDPKTPESKKTVISNDAMAIGQLLECLINRGLR